MNVELWSTSDGSNNATPPDGFPEGMNRSDYNNSARAMMGAIRRWYDDPEWQDFNASHVVSRTGVSTIRVAGVDLTAYYTAGRRIRLTGGGDNQGSINSSAFSAGNTDVTVTLDAGASVPVGTNAAYVHMIKSMRLAATYAVGNIVGQLPANTQSAALGTAAYKDTGTTSGLVALHTQSAALGGGAYLNAPARTFTLLNGGANQTITNSAAEAEVTGLNNITIPGTPNGSKKYKLTVYLQTALSSASDGLATVFVHVGTVGDKTDGVVLRHHQVVMNGSTTTDDACALVISQFELTPAASTKVTIGMTFANGTADLTIHKGNTTARTSHMEIQEIAA